MRIRRLRARRRDEGSALIIVMVVIMSVMVLALTVSQDAALRSRAASEDADSTRALWAAEVGIGLVVNDLAAAGGSLADGSLPATQIGTDASYTVTWTKEGGYYRIRATGAVPAVNEPVQRTVEVFVKSQDHPLFYKATYVANEEIGPDGKPRRLLQDYALRFGASKLIQGGKRFDETRDMNSSDRLSEIDHQVDFNNDGALDANPTIAEIYQNRVDWGWGDNAKKSGSDYYLNINKDTTTNKWGQTVPDFNDKVTAPTVEVDTLPRDPSSDNPPASTKDNWASMAKTDAADYVEGKVYANGDVEILGDTNVFGDVDAARHEDPDKDEDQWDTGEVTGAPVSGSSTNNSSYIAPPDLSNPTGDGVSSYADIADVIVGLTDGGDPTSPNGYETSGGKGGGNLPGFLSPELKPTQKQPHPYGAALTGTHDNPHIHLQNGSSSTLSFGQSLDGGLILVKGNLWVHDMSAFTIDMPEGSKQQITVVVEGNLYLSDDLNYSNEDNAVLFIVKGSDDNPENYIDVDRDYKWTEGVDQLMNDKNGNGEYDGPVEGQGNVFFGDPRFGTGGVTDGYIYAQNNVYLVNPPKDASPPSNAQDAIFGVYGFLSAGGVMDLGDRTGGSNYNNFRVKYDPRLENGTVKFKGMPKAMGGGWQGMAVESWREVND